MATKQVYGLVDPRTQDVRYIGCSLAPTRRLVEHLSLARGTRKHGPKEQWLRELLILGLRPWVRILEAQPMRWEESERAWIKRLREESGILVNVAEGGPGNRGWIPSPQWRAQVGVASSRRKGHTFSPAVRQRMVEGQAKVAPEVRARMAQESSERMRARTPEQIEHVATQLRGRKASDALRQKLSLAHQNPSDETRAKLAAAVLKRPQAQRDAFARINKGKTFSPEHRLNMSLAAKARWARVRAQKDGVSSPA